MTEARLIPICDTAAWTEALARFPSCDVYAFPGYVRAAARGGAAVLVEAETEGGGLIVPLVLHDLPVVAGMPGWRDADTPYGYGGVWARGPSAVWPACWAAVANALDDQRVVNAFLRLHPFADPEPPAHIVLSRQHETAWIPLSDGRDLAFSGERCATHRSQVHRAWQRGFTSVVESGPSARSLSAFQRLYATTMDRLGAARTYRFDEHYFHTLAWGLGTDLALVSVMTPDGDAVTQALFLLGPRYGHYHLSARREDAHNTAGHLLFESAADLAVSRGLEGIHLGGGFTETPDDGLWQYKRRIGRATASALIAGLVVDKTRHRRLVADWQHRTGRQPGWFQAYRQPEAEEDTQ